MRYDGDQLKAMADKIDLVDYIGETEELHRKGYLYYISCPLHSGDDTPSLCIYPDSQTWHCFGCKSGGDIYTWLVKHDNLTFPQAVERVAEMTGSELTGLVTSETLSVFKEIEKAKMGKPKAVFERKILDYQKEYLDKFEDEAPQEWLDEGMTVESLKHYNVRVDKVGMRIVYPVFDANGQFIGVKGRTRIPEYKELKICKYINYNKIYNLDYFQGWQQALPEIKNTKSVIIFEGIKSCIKAWCWGIKNTIASETSKLSEDQVKLLIKSGIGEVIIAYDSDQPFSSIASSQCIKTLTQFTKVSIIIDINHLLGEKESPVDRGEAVFRQLYHKRRTL